MYRPSLSVSSSTLESDYEKNVRDSVRSSYKSSAISRSLLTESQPPSESENTTGADIEATPYEQPISDAPSVRNSQIFKQKSQKSLSSAALIQEGSRTAAIQELMEESNKEFEQIMGLAAPQVESLPIPSEM
jgi:hypothetical protein